MGFRIDPVDERGVFDHDFYTSENYKAEVKVLLDYLIAEGFELKTEPFPITVRGRDWLVKPQSTTPKKK
jgi:hypothetical protein